MMWKWALACAAALVMVAGFAVRVALHNSATTGRMPEQTSATLAGSTSRNALPSETQSAEAVARSSHEAVLHRRHWSSANSHRTSELASDVNMNRETASFDVLAAPGEAAGLEQYMQQLRMRSIHVVAREEVKSSGRLEIRGVEIAEIDVGVITIPPLDGAK